MAHDFKQMIPERSDTTALVVDSLNLAFRWKHAGRSEFKDEYLATVESLARSYHAGRIIILGDSGKSAYRKAIYPEYKGNRDALYKDQTLEEEEFFKLFFKEYTDTLEMLKEKYEVYVYRGVEADDLAGHLVQNKEEYGLNKIWLVSSDRDWDLLVSDDVSRFSYVTRKEYTSDNWDEHYIVPQEQYIGLKCLEGDKGDNVPGVAGVGPKRAAGLLNTYGDIFGLIDALPIAGKAKYIQSLNDFGAERLLLNLELMDLVAFCDTAIGEENLQDLKERINARNSD